MIVQQLNYSHCHALWVWRMAIIQWINYSRRVVLPLSILLFFHQLTQLVMNLIS